MLARAPSKMIKGGVASFSYGPCDYRDSYPDYSLLQPGTLLHWVFCPVTLPLPYQASPGSQLSVSIPWLPPTLPSIHLKGLFQSFILCLERQ